MTLMELLTNALEHGNLDISFNDKTKTFRIEMNEYGTGLANRTYKDDIYEKGEVTRFKKAE